MFADCRRCVMPMYYVRVHKAWLGLGGHPWLNSYEVVTQNSTAGGVGVDPDDIAILDDFVASLVAFERALHLPAVFFSRAVVSTWIPDSSPYSGDELMTRPQA